MLVYWVMHKSCSLSVCYAPTPIFITISQCDLLSYDAPNLHLRVCCSKGTYIRSLAHDIGSKLNCGGHLMQLRRTHSGNFSVDQAIPLDTLLEEPTLLKKYLVTAKGEE